MLDIPLRHHPVSPPKHELETRHRLLAAGTERTSAGVQWQPLRTALLSLTTGVQLGQRARRCAQRLAPAIGPPGPHLSIERNPTNHRVRTNACTPTGKQRVTRKAEARRRKYGTSSGPFYGNSEGKRGGSAARPPPVTSGQGAGGRAGHMPAGTAPCSLCAWHYMTWHTTCRMPCAKSPTMFWHCDVCACVCVAQVLSIHWVYIHVHPNPRLAWQRRFHHA
jgi:hypothetical protein